MTTTWRWAFATALIAVTLGAGWLFFSSRASAAIQIEAPFAGTYSLSDLGSVPGLPTSYGGMTFKSDDPNKIIIGGAANDATGKLYSITVTRGAGSHITGFSGNATSFAVGSNNDGGVAYGPGNVLFYARYSNDEVGEIKPGSTTTDKVVDLAALGVTGSPGGLNFVPTGFPGAGELKVVSYNDGTWYTATYSPNASGTYNITAASHDTTLPGGPEGFTYVPPGSPLFPANSMLQAEYDNGNIVAYQLDASGNPKLATRTNFITGLVGAEGAVIDPMTGDFLFSTFGGGDHLVVIQGFVPPPTATASPSPSPTPSATSTAVATPSPTPAASPTPTATPISQTSSPTPIVTATPTPSLIWGDVDCGGDIAPRDGQAILKNVLAQNALSQTEPCPDVGAEVTVDGVSRIWGDIDCSGDIAPRDGQAILKNVLLQNALSQTEPCPDVGSTVQVVG